jgi:murein DD-endopeptidase MepM/ murein hydrolase activator NlpD
MTGGKAKYAAALAALPIASPILFLALIGGQASSTPTPTCPDAATPPVSGVADPELDAEQMSVANQVVAAVRAYPPTADKPRAAVIALAAARQESGIRNLDYGDRDSLGVFQQRPSQGWGTPQQVMNIAHATTSFLEHLIQASRWETRRVTEVAADVQRPAEAYRDRYEQWVPLANRLVEKLWPNVDDAVLNAAPSDCAQIMLASAGSVSYPVPPAYVGTDQHNWGSTGSDWSKWHTGTDFSIPCGTQVFAATSGTIRIDTGQPWAGRWLVKVITGPTSVATWYAHMQRLEVRAGVRVAAGQQIGEAGDLGNATGCHLHFEVHLHNGSIYGPDNVDPSLWLATNARSPRPRD